MRNLPGYIYGAVLIAILALTLVVPAIFAGWIAPHDLFTTSAYDRLAPPAWMDRGTAKNLLGADFLGRDLLSRLIHGGRTEFTVVALCIAGSSAIGVPLGLGARRWGGWRDAVIMRAASVVRWALVVIGFLYWLGIVIALVAWLVFLIRSVGRPAAAWSMLWTDRIRPGVGALASSLQVIGMLGPVLWVVSVLGASMGALVITIILFLWPQYAQVGRYDRLADLAPLATLHVGLIILLVSVFNFLGIGVSIINSPWGWMAYSGLGDILYGQAWWASFFPLLLIFINASSAVLLSKWLRSRLGPGRQV